MANFNDIKHEIDQNVNTNGVQAITGAILNETLKDMIDEVDEKKQDTLVAGQNITIQGNVISASGGGSGEEYYAGHGIDIDSNNVISADFNFVQEKLVDGQNIKSVNGEPILGSGDIDIPEYVEGNGIDITNLGYVNEISVDPSDLAGNGLFVDAQGNLAVNPSDIVGTGLTTEGDARIAVDPSVVQGKLTAGANIQISGNTISATNTTYNAGSGLNLNGTTFSADTTVLATKSDLQGKQDTLQAGNGLEIDGNNEISVKAGSGLGFDSNGYLINTGGGGGGTTYTAGDGIEIDSNDAINAKLGNGLQLDGSNNIEVDTSVVATQSDLGNYLPIGGGTLQTFVPGVSDTELTVLDGYNEDYVKIVAPDTPGEAPHVEIFENGSGDTKFFYDHLERGSQVSIDYPSSSGTIALTDDIPSASDLDGWGLTATQGGELEVDGSVLAGTGITWDPLNKVFNATGGSGSSLWVSDRGVDSLLSPGAHSNSISYASGQGAINAGNYSQADSQGGWISAAIGDFSTTFGTNTSATGDNSTAFGFKTKAEGDNSFVMGTTNSASGDNAFAGGSNASAFADNTFAFNGDALGQGSVAIGIGSEANGMNSVAIGSGARTDSMYAIALGTNSSAVAHSTAVGYNVSTGNAYETATGEFNKTYASNTYSSDSDKTHFSIGNGTDGNNRSNAFEIKKNNDAYLVGVGNYDGTNAGQAGVSTLQAVINSGGQGTVYSSGQGIDITNNTISVDATDLDGSGLSVDANGALEVDTTTIQEKLVSGTNLKTINGNSLLGSGDLVISGGQSLSAGSGIDITSNVISVEPDLTLESLTVKNDTNSNLTTVSCSSPNTTGNIRSVNINVSKDVSGAPGKSNINLQSDGNYASAGDTYSVGLNNNGSISVSYKDSGNQSQVATINYPQKSGTIALLSDISGGGGSSYSAGSGIDITNNTISVDTTTIQEKLTAGANIQISGNTISATDTNTTYSAGSGLNLNGTTFSADTTVLQEKLVSGTNIKTVNGNSLLGSGDLVISGGQSYSAGSGIDITNNTISVDNTIATVSDLGGYLPLTGGTLQEDPNDSASTELLIQSPETYATADLTTVDLDPGNTPESLAKLTLSDYDSSSNPHTAIYGTDGISNGTYKISFPTLTQDDTFALLSDVQGGGSSYSAGTGINIDANNVISNSAPDPGLWVAGTGTNSIRSSNAVSAGGNNAFVFGQTASASCNGAIVLGRAASAINTGLNCVAIGNSASVGNTNEVALGPFNYNNINGTTAEKTHFTVGNGTGNAARSNLIEAKQNNDIYIYGVGGFTGANAGQSGVETLQAVLSGKQDTLVAGSGISISGNVISATGGGGGSSLWTSGTGTDSLVAPGTVSAGLTGDAAGTGAVSCGYDSNANGDYSFACGGASLASGDYSFAANNATASGDYSAAFSGSGAYGANSFAAGGGSIAGPDNSVALGGGNVVFDDETDPQNPIDAQFGVAIGEGSIVNGEYGTAIGAGVVEAGGNGSVAIGSGSTAAGLYDVAVAGGNSRGNYSFAASSGQTDSQGHYSSALSGGYATGEASLASGQDSNSFSYSSIALGLGVNTYDQVDGSDRLDTNAGEVALGRYNFSESGIIFSIGCGYYDTEGDQEVRENSVAIDTDGKIYLKGLGGYTGQGVSGCTDLVSFLNNL